MNNPFRTLIQKLKHRYSQLSRRHKRLLLVSFILSLSSLLAAEGYLWIYGSNPEAATLPVFGLVSTRQLLIGLRILLLTLWSYYVSYQLVVQPALSAAAAAYRLQRQTLPPALAALRAYNRSPEFNRVFSTFLSLLALLLVLRVGFILSFSFFFSSYLLSISFFYFDLKAGRYPDAEPEFWGEVSEASFSAGKKLFTPTTVAAAIGGVTGFGLGLHTNYSNERIATEKIASNEQIAREQIAFNERIAADKHEAEIKKYDYKLLKEQNRAAELNQQQKQQRSGWFK